NRVALIPIEHPTSGLGQPRCSLLLRGLSVPACPTSRESATATKPAPLETASPKRSCAIRYSLAYCPKEEVVAMSAGLACSIIGHIAMGHSGENSLRVNLLIQL